MLSLKLLLKDVYLKPGQGSPLPYSEPGVLQTGRFRCNPHHQLRCPKGLRHLARGVQETETGGEGGEETEERREEDEERGEDSTAYGDGEDKTGKRNSDKKINFSEKWRSSCRNCST